MISANIEEPVNKASNFVEARIIGGSTMKSHNGYILAEKENLEEDEKFKTCWYRSQDEALNAVSAKVKRFGGNLISYKEWNTLNLGFRKFYSLNGNAGVYSVPKSVASFELEDYQLRLINDCNRFASNFREDNRLEQSRKKRQESAIWLCGLGLITMLICPLIMIV